MGLTRDHAKLTWFTQNAEANQKNLLSAARILTGVTHKGALRATVIRRKREDFEECRQKYKETEKAAFEEARRGPNPKETLAALSKYKRCMDETLARTEENAATVSDSDALQGEFKRPDYKVIHSSEFDLLDYRYDTGGEGPPTRPKTLKVEISLPGIDSSACIELDVTENKVYLQVRFIKNYLP